MLLDLFALAINGCLFLFISWDYFVDLEPRVSDLLKKKKGLSLFFFFQASNFYFLRHKGCRLDKFE